MRSFAYGKKITYIDYGKKITYIERNTKANENIRRNCGMAAV